MSTSLRIGAVRGNAVCADSLHTGQDAASSDTDAYDCQALEEYNYRPVPTFPGCSGLPYPDHNYVLPPQTPPPSRPPTPPPAPPQVVCLCAEVEETQKVTSVVIPLEEVVEDSVTRCICGYLHDDGFMICCDKCSVWQHLSCMNIDRNNIPDNFCCELCEPRPVDYERARLIQQRRREELASLGRKTVQPKVKGTKQRRVSKGGTRMAKAGKLAKSQQMLRDKKLKLTKKEKENMKDLTKRQKLGKSGLPKQKKLKKKLNQLQAQNEVDSWNSDGPLFSMGEVRENEYSAEVLEFLSRAKTNGIHSPHTIGVFPEEMIQKLYQVVDVKNNSKGLEATDTITAGKAVVDYKGKVMLRQHYKPEPFLDQSELYVLYYSKFEGLDLCVDASTFGGDARYIRRSCTPNAEMCHIIDNGKLLFIVQARKEIAKGTEITIPFDFSYQDSLTSIECACSRNNCPVNKYWKKIRLAQKSPDKPKRKREASGEGRRNSVSKGSPARSGKLSPVKNSPVKSPASVTPLSYSFDDPILSVDGNTTDDIQVASPVKSGPISRRGSKAGSDIKEEKDVKPCRSTLSKEFNEGHPAPSSTSHASESEADSAGECPKKLTREEKKLQDIMKYFDKMEKRKVRRESALGRQKKPKTDLMDTTTDHTASACSNGQAASNGQCSDPDNKLVIKLEDPPAADSPHKNRHKKGTKRKRRNSRVMSAIEPLCSPPPKRPNMWSNSTETRADVEEVKVKEEPADHYQFISYSAPNTACIDSESSSMEADSYIFHKKKTHLMSERSGSRSTESRTESIDTQDGEEEMFVACTPSPRNAMDHIQRRNSLCRQQHTSFKKRWLQLAENESKHPEPSNTATQPAATLYGPPACLPSPELVSPSPTSSRSPQHPGAAPVVTGNCAAFEFSQPRSMLAAASVLAHLSPIADNCSEDAFRKPMKKRWLSSSSGAQPATPTTARSELPATITSATESHLEQPAPSASLHFASCALPTGWKAVLATELRARRALNLLGVEYPRTFEDEGAKENRIYPGPESICNVSMETEDECTMSNQGELSMDGLNSSYSHQPNCSASAGRSASATLSADSAGINECSSDSVGGAASSSSALGGENDSGIEMPLVDSSGAGLEADLPEVAQQSVRGSDSISVCSSDNEVSAVAGRSADSQQPTETASRACESMAESSSALMPRHLEDFEDQDANISESRQSEEPMEVEEEGNEASGNASEVEEPCSNAETSTASSQLFSDCQVNSSQDCAQSSRLPVVDNSPNSAEAECQNCIESLPIVDRTLAGTAVTSAQDSHGSDRERSGVSSAQDNGAVTSHSAVERENSVLFDMDCGPSSSTQVFRSVNRISDSCAEVSACNSGTRESVSDYVHIPSVAEDNSVDSTTQNSQTVMTSFSADAADSQLQAVDNKESCCDSNTDEQANCNTASSENAGVSSSNQGDSVFSDVAESSVGVACTSNSMVSSSASVSSSLSGRSHRDLAAPGMQVSRTSVVIASCSTLPTWRVADCFPGPSLSMCNSSPGAVNSSPGVDSASVENSAAPVTSALDMDSRDMDDVGTSSTFSDYLLSVSDPCTSSHVHRLSDDGEQSVQPGSSGLVHRDSDSAVSSAVSGLDGVTERGMTNGELASSVSVSSFSEDSCGSSSASNPCSTVSSSEAQAAPSAACKRKVSLSEYRSRRKEKTGPSTSNCSSTSPKSSFVDRTPRRGLDDNITLTPLPLFEPITINRESRDNREEKPEKPQMKLVDRLRIEFGCDTISEEEDRGLSSGHRMSSKDIPPPPPPPPNGVVGGGRRPSSTVGKAGSSESEEEGRQVLASPTATATSSVTSAPYNLNGNSSNASQPAQGQVTPQPGTGLSWLANFRNVHVLSGGGVAAPTAPLPLPTGLFGPSAVPQQLPVYNNGPGRPSATLRMLNGSHAPAPAAAFPTGAMYPPTQSQAPPTDAQTQPFSAAPPPPPPPSTAYPFLAQSRTHSQHPPPAPRGRSGSLSQTAHSSVSAGSRSARSRHSSGEASSLSSSSSQGRHHYYNQDRQTVKHRSPFSDRKRN